MSLSISNIYVTLTHLCKFTDIDVSCTSAMYDLNVEITMLLTVNNKQ